MKKENNEDLRQLWVLLRNGLVVLCIPIMIWTFWVATESAGLQDAVALDHALTARNVVTGQGMTSPVITPLHLNLGGDPERAGPIFAKPLFVLWQAVIFKIGRIADLEAMVASGIPWILSAWLVFLLAYRLHSIGAAWLCFFIFVFNPTALDLSVSGRPETMGMLLIILIFSILAGALPRPDTDDRPYVLCFISGFLTATLSLSVPYAAPGIILLLGWFWYHWARRAGCEPILNLDEYELSSLKIAVAWVTQRLCVRFTVVFLSGLLLPLIISWFVRVVLPGALPMSLTRYLVLIDTSSMPGWSVWRTYHLLDTSWLQLVSVNLVSIFLKFSQGLATGFEGVLTILHPVLFALFIFALIHPECGEKQQLRWKLFALVPLHVAVMAFFYADPAYLSIWIPIFILIGVGSFEEFFQLRLLKGEERRRYRNPYARFKLEAYAYHIPILLIIVFTVSPFFFRVTGNTAPAKLTPTSNLTYLMDHQDLYTAIGTPAPWMVSWFGGGRAIWLSETKRDFDNLEEKHPGLMQAVYLPQTRAEILHDRVPSWWFFALQQPETLADYEAKDAVVWGEALYTRKETAEP